MILIIPYRKIIRRILKLILQKIIINMLLNLTIIKMQINFLKDLNFADAVEILKKSILI